MLGKFDIKMNNIQPLSNNPKNTVPQGMTETPVKASDNKELALKGRFVVIVSFLTAIHTLGYIKLDKLPFIGGSVNASNPNDLTVILLIVLAYALYKYWVYKRIAELDS
jgi:hypothetical protein